MSPLLHLTGDSLGYKERKKGSSLFVCGGRCTGEKKWLLSSCLITQPDQEPWPCSQTCIMKGWLYTEISTGLQSPYHSLGGEHVSPFPQSSTTTDRPQGKGMGEQASTVFDSLQNPALLFWNGRQHTDKDQKFHTIPPAPFHCTDGWLRPIRLPSVSVKGVGSRVSPRSVSNVWLHHSGFSWSWANYFKLSEPQGFSLAEWTYNNASPHQVVVRSRQNICKYLSTLNSKWAKQFYYIFHWWVNMFKK